MIGPELQDKLIRTWLSTPFEGGRHARRVAKIAALESACAEKLGEQGDPAAAGQ
jgi:ribose 5-phosphate isomerase B